MNTMRLVAVSVAVLFTSCVSASFTTTNPSPRPLQARPLTEVTVYTTTLPDRPYVEVGIVSARSTDELSKERSQLLQTLREKSAQEGCDAIIMTGGSPLHVEATCIVFK